MTKKKLVFIKVDGTIIKDVNQYVKDWIKDNPYGEVIIGCDSQQHSRYIKYSTVIVMHRIDEFEIGHGAHVISTSIIDRSKNIKSDIYSKLWAEAEYTIKAAQMLDGCTKKIKIHLDYNSNENEYSNVLYASGLGYLNSLGFEAYGKPNACCSSIVADRLAKKGSL